MNVVYAPADVIIKLGSQFLDSEKMRIQPTASDFVSSRLSHHGTAETGYHRADKHHASPQFGTTRQKLIALHIFHVHLVGLERKVARSIPRDFHTDIFQQTDLVVHIRDVGYVFDTYRF